MTLDLEAIDVGGLDVQTTPYDLRRDLHAFVQYVREYEVKRLVRDNSLSVVDYRRLATWLSDPTASSEIEAGGHSTWIDFVDWVALRLGFVSYDTEGIYRGYSSQSPSFYDNYIEYNPEDYQAFLDASLVEQERRLRSLFVDQDKGCNSEFFSQGYFGRLSPFYSGGCATGVIPELDFPKARRFLLKLLSRCEVGEWFSVASFVQYLKANDPYFLIPKEPPEYRLGWKETSRSRYTNFREATSQWDRGEQVPDDAPDGFERVEGRYVERFLESAPLTLGYVELAYGNEPEEELFPSRGHLKAFRVNRRLVQAQRRTIPAPSVTVQPNFEIYVESAFYPASVIERLRPLAEVRSEDLLTILKLDRDRIMATLVQDEDLDVVDLLQKISDRPLPNNVVREVREWTARADVFTLYEGFALLEGEEDVMASDPVIQELTVDVIVPGVRLLRSADAAFDRLEAEVRVPLRVEHGDAELTPLPRGSQTRFLAEEPAAEREPEPKPRVSLTRSTNVLLHATDEPFLKDLQQALLDAKCPVRLDEREEMLIVPGIYRDRVAAAIEALRERYDIDVKEPKAGG